MYERYQTLVQNLFHGVSEENALRQIDIKEIFPIKKEKEGRCSNNY